MKRNYLEHYGTKGMHWGERLYQNPDGSLTPAGKLRYGVRPKLGQYKSGKPTIRERIGYAKSKSAPDPSTFHEDYRFAHDKSIKVYQMSDKDLAKINNRLKAEQKYYELNPRPISRGKAFVEQAMSYTKKVSDFIKDYESYGNSLSNIKSYITTGKLPDTNTKSDSSDVKGNGKKK